MGSSFAWLLTPREARYYLLTNRCTFGSRWSDIVEQVRALASHAHFH